MSISNQYPRPCLVIWSWTNPSCIKYYSFSWIPLAYHKLAITQLLAGSMVMADWHVCNDGLPEEKITEALILALNTHDKLFCVARRCQCVQGDAASLEVFGSPVDLYGNWVETTTRMNYTGYKFITVLLY